MGWTKQRNALAAAGLSLIAGAAHAELTVVADYGGQSAQPYYESITGSRAKKPNDQRQSQRKAGLPETIRQGYFLPVHSKLLSPGPVDYRKIKIPATMTRPFFLIGADPLSQRWLKKRGPRLRELNAVGLVVDVETPVELKRLRQLADGLMLQPVAGDDIAKRLGLSHYPVLITSTGVQQ